MQFATNSVRRALRLPAGGFGTRATQRRSAGTLVLNADYTAISFTSERRGLLLMMNEKAQMLEQSGRRFVSEFLDLPRPSVIVLKQYQKMSYTRKPIASCRPSKQQIFARDKARCQYCGAKANTIDHIIPRCRGGGDTWENLVASCQSCNFKKANRDLAKSGLTLSRPPQPPQAQDVWYKRNAFLSGKTVQPEWKQYLSPQRASR